jgi:hypothetical protein
VTTFQAARSAEAWKYHPDVRIENGKVIEKGPEGSRVFIQWSKIKDGKRVFAGDSPIQVIDATGQTAFDVPPGRGIVDANQWISYPNQRRQRSQNITALSEAPTDEAVSYLELASFVEVDNNYVMTPLQSFVADHLGFGTPLWIPDLFADTNGDGEIGAGDVLYATVNLAEYYPAQVTFDLGDTFTIVNGLCEALPGMLFGTEPIIPDASSPTGYLNPSPFNPSGLALNATASGDASALAAHGVVATPDLTSSLPLFSLALLALGFCRQSRAAMG